ncbi:MAG TPA: DUF1853 family protein [Aequorivita sp.]|nr:DUF1853 family protein [Aequorivita sp.]
MDDFNFNFPSTLVLGMQAEFCFEEYLKRSPFFELLASNIQIQGENETLGELDYIVLNKSTQLISHIELACKFYLFDANISAPQEAKWIGPNRKDSLFDKLEKIRLKQFPMIRKPETIQTLQAHNVEIPTEQELCLKAFLFIPKSIEVQDFPTNYQECIVGRWMNLIDFEKEDPLAQYAIPSKKEWLLPVDKIESWHSFSEIHSMVSEQLEIKKSPLLYKKTKYGLERLFVVWW